MDMHYFWERVRTNLSILLVRYMYTLLEEGKELEGGKVFGGDDNVF